MLKFKTLGYWSEAFEVSFVLKDTPDPPTQILLINCSSILSSPPRKWSFTGITFNQKLSRKYCIFHQQQITGTFLLTLHHTILIPHDASWLPSKKHYSSSITMQWGTRNKRQKIKPSHTPIMENNSCLGSNLTSLCLSSAYK